MPQEHFRLTARHRVRAPVVIRIDGAPTRQRATLVNLGLSGACVDLEEAPTAGTEAIIEIQTPLRWDPLRLKGQVVWACWNADSARFRAGLRFYHDDATHLFCLFELIESQRFEQ